MRNRKIINLEMSFVAPFGYGFNSYAAPVLGGSFVRPALATSYLGYGGLAGYGLAAPALSYAAPALSYAAPAYGLGLGLSYARYY